MSQKGVAPLIVLLCILILLSAAGGGYYFINRVGSAKTPQNKEGSDKIILPADTQVSSSQDNSSKPDLVIEKITYKNTSVRTDGYGMPVMGLGKDLDFTITVKNIGTADFKGSFYVFNSRSETDFAESYHSHGELANLKEEIIPVNGFLDITVTDSIDEETKNVLFSINYRSKSDKKDVSLQLKDESNYENNSYKLTIN